MTHFYILGDMGSGLKSQYDVSKSMGRHILKNIDNSDTFICGLGDNIYECGCEDINDIGFEDKFEKPYRNISDNIKFYMCLGNHDYGNYGFGDPMAQVEYGRLCDMKGGKWYMPNKYYTFRKGDIDFFVLDTNFDEMDDNDSKDKQLEYFKTKIKQSKAKWKIVYGHHTWRSVGGHGNAESELEEFLSVLLKYVDFDIYMCGHDHNKQIIDLNLFDKDVTLIVCGTGGKVYDDKNNYMDLNKDSDLLFCSNNLGYGYFIQEGNKLYIYFYNEKDQIEYIHLIKK